MWEGAGPSPVVGKHLRKRGQGPSMTVGIVKPPHHSQGSCGEKPLAIVEGKEAAIVVKPRSEA